MAPPVIKSGARGGWHGINKPPKNELAEWHKKYHSYFELGTVYTMIAGLLNVLVIFDAAAGPVGTTVKKEEEEEEEDSAAEKKE